jgi:small subunit ribosomal protein S18
VSNFQGGGGYQGNFAGNNFQGNTYQNGGGNKRSKFGRFGGKRREVEPEEPLDYKNIAYLTKFMTPNGKIQSRKRTGFNGQNQRMLALAIKRARMLGLMPFVGRV